MYLVNQSITSIYNAAESINLIVSILASFCVWRKSLMYKRCCKQEFHLSEHFQKTLHCEIRRFQIPCQLSGRRVIPSGRPSVHCSICPDNVSYRPDARQTSIICPDDVSFRPEPPLYREASVPTSIRPDLSASCPDVHQ